MRPSAALLRGSMTVSAQQRGVPVASSTSVMGIEIRVTV
jgi:hypothetical protein